MNFPLASIYIISFLLFVTANIPPYKPRSYPKLEKRHTLTQAIIVGNKSSLKREIKKQYKALHLQHLFTPSGLHLSILLFLISPLLSLTKKLYKHFPFMIKITFFISLQFLDFFWSLKRMAIYYSMGKKYSPRLRFFLTYIFSWILGHYQESSLSFIFSFLFFGIIITTGRKSKWQLLLSLYTGQIMIAYFFQRPIYSLGPILGTFWTGLFSIFLPFFIINALFPSFSAIYFIFNLWEKGISLSFYLAKYSWQFTPSLTVLLISILISSIFSKLKSD